MSRVLEASKAAANKIWRSASAGVKAVAEDYGVKGAVSAGIGAVGGAIAGAKTVAHVGTTVAIRGGTKAIVKGAVAGSGIGSAAAFLPDVWTFGKAAVKAWNDVSIGSCMP